MNKTAIVLVILGIIAGIIHFFQYWTVLGLLFLKFGLGMKVAGAKTFGKAVIKIGGKKALVVATSGMLIKRHIIDLLSKFFADHSIKKYKKNVVLLFKMKFNEMMNSSGLNKLKSIGTMLLSFPVLYFVWTKVLSAFLQKFVYALVLPIAMSIWTFLISSLGIVSTAISFLFQVFILNMGLNFLEKYKYGRWFLSGVDKLVDLFGDAFGYLNKFFMLFGFDPQHYMTVKSIKFNRWLEKLLDKGLNQHEKVQMRRERHLTGREILLLKREERKIKQETPKSVWKKTKGLYKKKVLKHKTYIEKREIRKEVRANKYKRIEYGNKR